MSNNSPILLVKITNPLSFEFVHHDMVLLFEFAVPDMFREAEESECVTLFRRNRPKSILNLKNCDFYL